MDDRDLEQRTVGRDPIGQIADERDVVDHLVGHPAARVAHDHRVPERETRERGGIHPRIQAGDDEGAVPRHHRHPHAGVGTDEGNLALMQQRGWVAATHTSTSGRSLAMTITDDGTVALAQAHAAWHEAQTGVLAQLGEDARATLDSWLDGLADPRSSPDEPHPV
jgi:hypothetical protein